MSTKAAVCVLVSGGLDSDVLLAQMTRKYSRVQPVYVRQGLSWETSEMYWLKRFLKWMSSSRKRGSMDSRPRGNDSIVGQLYVLNLPMNDVYGNHWSLGKKPVPGTRTKDEAVYLPGRNLVLTVKTAVYCAMKGISTIVLGSLDHNPFPDATPAFFREWGNALSHGLAKPIRLLAPYRHRSKAEVIKAGRSLPLWLSFSCIDPRGTRHCGKCNKCAERRRAFSEAKVEDKTTYAY